MLICLNGCAWDYPPFIIERLLCYIGNLISSAWIPFLGKIYLPSFPPSSRLPHNIRNQNENHDAADDANGNPGWSNGWALSPLLDNSQPGGKAHLCSQVSFLSLSVKCCLSGCWLSFWLFFLFFYLIMKSCVRHPGMESSHCTVILSATADGNLLPPFVIFRVRTFTTYSYVLRCHILDWGIMLGLRAKTDKKYQSGLSSPRIGCSQKDF